MKYSLHVDPKAIEQATKIYRSRERDKKGSGERFINALVETYAQIKSNPFSFQLRKDHYRHAHLHRLKYRVVYEVEGADVFVYQVRHTSRKVSKKYGP